MTKNRVEYINLDSPPINIWEPKTDTYTLSDDTIMKTNNRRKR
jgi:hypothetical protein